MIPPPQHHILSNYNVLNLNAHHPLMQNVLNIFNCSIMSYEQKKKKTKPQHSDNVCICLSIKPHAFFNCTLCNYAPTTTPAALIARNNVLIIDLVGRCVWCN